MRTELLTRKELDAWVEKEVFLHGRAIYILIGKDRGEITTGLIQAGPNGERGPAEYYRPVLTDYSAVLRDFAPYILTAASGCVGRPEGFLFLPVGPVVDMERNPLCRRYIQLAPLTEATLKERREKAAREGAPSWILSQYDAEIEAWRDAAKFEGLARRETDELVKRWTRHYMTKEEREREKAAEARYGEGE